MDKESKKREYFITYLKKESMSIYFHVYLIKNNSMKKINCL